MDPKINQIIIDTLLPYKPKQICVFGSYARGEMDSNGDYDITYKFNDGISIIDIIRMKFDLEARLNRKVDFVGRNGLHKRLLPYILKDLKVIYESKK